MAVVVNAKTRILENADVHMVKEDAITRIEETAKLREILGIFRKYQNKTRRTKVG